MKYPFISVIVPTLNEEKYIENSLKAIRNQKYAGKYELIIADGISKDNTIKIAKKYTQNIVLVKKKGIAAGRNAGALRAKGEILVFLDGDTMPSSNLLSDIAKAFRNKEVVGAACKLYPIGPDQSIKNLYKFYNKFMKLTIKMKKASIPGVCCIYKKSVFRSIGKFNENLPTFEDVEFSLKANELGKIVMLPNSFALTSSRRVKKLGAKKAFFIYLFNFLKFYSIGKGFSAEEYKPIR